jgi:hypothetical protein
MEQSVAGIVRSLFVRSFQAKTPTSSGLTSWMCGDLRISITLARLRVVSFTTTTASPVVRVVDQGGTR